MCAISQNEMEASLLECSKKSINACHLLLPGQSICPFLVVCSELAAPYHGLFPKHQNNS